MGLKIDVRSSFWGKDRPGTVSRTLDLGGKKKFWMQVCVSPNPADFQIISEYFEKKDVEEKGGVSKKHSTKS